MKVKSKNEKWGKNINKRKWGVKITGRLKLRDDKVEEESKKETKKR